MKRAMRVLPLTQVDDYPGEFHMATKKQIYKHMKRAMRAIPLTQEHDYIGEFHMATKKQIYNHMKRACLYQTQNEND